MLVVLFILLNLGESYLQLPSVVEGESDLMERFEGESDLMERFEGESDLVERLDRLSVGYIYK